MQILRDFNLHNIPYIFATTDCASNMKKCFPDFFKNPRIPCFLHVMHNFLFKILEYSDHNSNNPFE